MSWMRTWAVMAKEFGQLRRDRLTYAMILVLPIVQLLLFGYAINGDPRRLETAVLVQDHGAMSRSILTALENSDYFDITHVARTPSELDEALQRGEVKFALTIPADFSRRVIRGDGAQILVEADATDPAATSGALAALANLPRQALERDLAQALGARRQASAPFEVVIHRRYNPEGQTAFNIVPGLLAIILSIFRTRRTASVDDSNLLKY